MMANKISLHTIRKIADFNCVQAEFYEFVNRVTNGKYAGKVELFELASGTGLDEYSLRAKGGKIVIYATSGSAAGSALNRYLQKYCRYYYGILTQSGALPENPPETVEDLVEKSVFQYRYAFNYCTFGYSYAFNTWKDWERITDYLILAGYNLVLNPIGNECVWLELLQKFGYTREEAKAHISAPNYLPWQWMMNLSSFKSEYPDYWFEEQREIAKRFNKKLENFGMSAVMPGYCGAVPDDFGDRHDGLTILNQGIWGAFERPSILLPTTNLFFDIAREYYKLQDELLGAQNMHYYSIDPFHEGGDKGDIDLGDYAKKVLSSMRELDENAVWVLQGWNGNPDRTMLSALEKGDVLIVNLHADGCPDGGDDLLGYPHVYCVVNNFGGEQAMRGSALKTYHLPHAMAQDEKSACVGVGIIPEGVECDEVLFDIVSEISIKMNLRSVEDFLGDYINARYGIVNDELVDIYKQLFENVYIDDKVDYEHESGLLALPSTTNDRVCRWAGRSTVQDNTFLTDYAKVLLKYYNECKDSNGYIKDLVAITRQFIANESWKFIYPMQKAIIEKDKESFENKSKIFLQLFDLQKRVVDCDLDLNLQYYLNKAIARGKDEATRKWLEKVAKLLITLWVDKRYRGLNDYAAREYGDMLQYFYKPRWELFFESVKEYFDGKIEEPIFEDIDFEIKFINDSKEYSLEERKNLDEVVKDVFVFFDKLYLGEI